MSFGKDFDCCILLLEALVDPEQTFYRDGLRFSCTRCNKCCRHESGYVFLSDRDIEQLRQRFSMNRQDFLDRYTQLVDLGLDKRISLTEQENFDCVFWAHGGCSVYEDRPLQCRAFPFWPQNLSSEEAWEETASECPGIHLGKRHSFETIQEWLERRRRDGFAN